MATFTVRTAITEYLILKYVKTEGVIPKATIIREAGLHMPNKPGLTYRVLNSHIESLVSRGKLTELEAEEYEVSPLGMELLLRRRAWVKRWITVNSNVLGMNNTSLLNEALDKESSASITKLEYENTIAAVYDDQLDDMSSAEPDDLVELYSQLKALNSEVLQLREDMQQLKTRANSSFKTVFKILKEHSHAPTLEVEPEESEPELKLVDSSE